MFRLYRLKDSHHLIPALFDVVRMPKSPGKVSLYHFSKRAVDNTTAGAVLLD
jgi:hypothetical protein